MAPTECSCARDCVPGLQLKGGLLFVSEDDRLPYKRDLNNFGPRVGVAYLNAGLPDSTGFHAALSQYALLEHPHESSAAD